MTLLTQKDWWKGAVIYQIYPRSFADSNHDGIGDLPGMTQKLSYIADLGADAIWISPIFKSPMKDFGYDVEDYRQIDPVFGTLADFDACIHTAHTLGLKVMIDQVLSHTSDLHPWFKESRSRRQNDKHEWYIWADANSDGTPPNNWQSVFGGSAWTWDARRKQYYFHNFLSSQPDLNFHTPEVQTQLLADVEFWLKRGVDGFRFDTANYLHHDRLLRNNPVSPTAVPGVQTNPYDMQTHLYDKNRPENGLFFENVRVLMDKYGAATMGEVGDADPLPLMIEYTQANKRLNMTYSFSFLDEIHTATHIKKHVSEFENASQHVTSAWPCWTIGNHDAARVLTRWSGVDAPDDFIRMQCAMLCSLRGSICWYQGDELVLENAELEFEQLQDPRGIAFWPEDKGRDGCRTPMPWEHLLPHAGFSLQTSPWLPIPTQHINNAVSKLASNPQAAFHFIKAFLAWRKKEPSLTHGTIKFLNGSDDVLALIRSPADSNDSDSWLCVFNFTSRSLNMILEDAPHTEEYVLPQLPKTQCGSRQDQTFTLPSYGMYWGKINRS